MGKHRSSRGFSVDGSEDEQNQTQEPALIVTDEEGKPLGEYQEPDDMRIAGVEIPDIGPGSPRQEQADPRSDATETDKRYTALEANLASINQARAADLKRIADLEAENASLGERAQNSDVAVLASGLEMAKQTLAEAKQRYKAARAANDVDAELQATEDIQNASSDIREFENAATEFRARPKPEPRPAPTQQTQQVEQNYDRQVDELMGTWTPKAQEFGKRFRAEIFGDGSSIAGVQKVVGAHHLALANGHEQDSDGYFDFIEKQAGLGSGKAPEPKPTPKTPIKRPQMAAAPVSNGGNGRGGPQSVALSPREREHARKMGMTDIEYAQGKLQVLEGTGREDYTGPRYSKDRPYVQTRRG